MNLLNKSKNPINIIKIKKKYINININNKKTIHYIIIWRWTIFQK